MIRPVGNELNTLVDVEVFGMPGAMRLDDMPDWQGKPFNTLRIVAEMQKSPHHRREFAYQLEQIGMEVAGHRGLNALLDIPAAEWPQAVAQAALYAVRTP